MKNNYLITSRWASYLALSLVYWLAMYIVNRWYYPDTDWRKMLFVMPLYLTVVAVDLWVIHQIVKRRRLRLGLSVLGVFFAVSYALGLFLTYIVAPAWNIRLHREEAVFSFAEYTVSLLLFHYTYMKYALGVFFIERGLSLGLKLKKKTWLSWLFRRRSRVLARQNHTMARDLGAKKISLHFLGNVIHRLYAVGEAEKRSGIAFIQNWDQVIDYSLEVQGEAGHALVALRKEVTILRDMMASDGTDRTIAFTILGELAGFKIPRLTLVTCYENILKHGDLTDSKCMPSIDLEISPNRLILVARNKIAENKAWESPHGGSGLAKMRRNLELSYGGNFKLAYGAETKCFTLELSLYR